MLSNKFHQEIYNFWKIVLLLKVYVLNFICERLIFENNNQIKIIVEKCTTKKYIYKKFTYQSEIMKTYWTYKNVEWANSEKEISSDEISSSLVLEHSLVIREVQILNCWDLRATLLYKCQQFKDYHISLSYF